MALSSLRHLQDQSSAENEDTPATIARLRQGVRKLIEIDRGPHWNLLHAALGSVLSECVQEDVVVNASKQIAAPALRMSKECWRLTWSLLCLRDKISVTHVCSLWRSLALGMPILWATLDFHSSRSSAPSASTDVAEVHPWPRLLLFTRVLDRSGALPLRLTIHLDKSWSGGDCIHNLAACLITHSHRLVAVEFQLGFGFERGQSNAMAVRTFLEQTPHLPALQSLFVHHPADSQFYPEFLPNLVNLPALRQLTVPDFSAPSVGHLPSVRRLHCTYSSTPQLIAFLKLCPGLCELDVTMDNTFDSRGGPGDGLAELRRLLSPIDRLHVHKICVASEEKAPALFHHIFVSELMLHYGPYTHSFDGFRVFEDIAHPTEVECRIERGRTVLKARDASQAQRVRGLSFLLYGPDWHAALAVQMWSKLCPKLLTTVTVDMHMLPALINGLSKASALRHLSIILPRHLDFEMNMPASIPPERRPFVPALQVVRFQGEREFGLRVVSAATLTTILRYLDRGQSPHHLHVHIEHLDLRGSLDDDILVGRGLTVVYHRPHDFAAA